MDISDLRNEIAHGRTVAQIASFLCRDEEEVREKMKELGLGDQREAPLERGPERAKWTMIKLAFGAYQVSRVLSVGYRTNGNC